MTKPSPNIVLVIMDDLAWGDLACHGNPVTHTPNLDRLYAESSHLTRYCSGPLCSPARASLMTGRYHLRTRVLDTYCGRSTLDPNEWTLAQALQGAGYHTGAFGKWHLGDNYPSRALDLGFDETLVHRAGGIGQPGDHPDNYPRWHIDSYFDPVLYHNGQPVRTPGYCTDIFFDAAMHFIDRHQDGPFFAYIATNAPHTPLLVGDEWTDRYRKLGVNETHARLYGMVENIDWNMGRLLAQLADLGVADNTIVIYTSDHGPCGSAQHNGEDRWNGGLRGLKGTMYEGGIRVPCFLRWPGHLPVGHYVDRVAHPIDILPTLLAACGIPIPEDLHTDGVDLLPILRGDVALDVWPDRPIFMQWHRGDLPVRYRNYAVITQRHKLYRPHESQTDELYDIEADPLESQDRAAEQPEQVAALRALYDAWLDEMATTRGLTTFDPLSISVGTPHENPVLLTQNDWRIIGDEGWNQDNLRGYWSVAVAKAQTYNVQVRFRSGLPTGVVHLRLGDETQRRHVQADQTQLSFDALELLHGKVVVECWLETDDAYPPAYFRRYVPALYVQFEATLVSGDNQTKEVL